MPPPNPPTIEINLPGFNPGIFRGVVLLGFLAWAGWSSVYTVPAESVGVIQRFGKALETTVPPVSVAWKKFCSSTSCACVWWRMKTMSIFS